MNRRRETREERRQRVLRNRLILAAVLVVLIVVVIIIIISCSHKKPAEPKKTTPAETTAETETTAPSVTIPNEKPVYLYTMDYGTMTCDRANTITKAWTVDEDLESFGAFCSSAESFPFNNETEAHQADWNAIASSANYKIGYELSFDVGGEHKIITIRQPGDIENNPDLYMGDYPEGGDFSDIPGYMGVWVYDDLNQDGDFYIHLTQAEVTPETLLTSIKLRPTPQSDQISNLVLKAFSYSSDEEFDSAGHYAGNYASQVTINRA